MKLVWSITSSGEGHWKQNYLCFATSRSVTRLSACFWYRIAAVAFNIPLSYGFTPTALDLSVRRHKQGLMQWQHFSILFLNQLIINIAHPWLYYLSYTFPCFLLSLFFLPSSALVSAKLCSRPYREKEKMGQSCRGSSRAQSSYRNKSETRNREVLEALCCASGIIAQLWWHTNSVFYF